MTRFASMIALATMLALPATAADTLTGQRAHIARELPAFGYRNVDVRGLSSVQVSHINNLIHSGRSQGDISGQIGTVLAGGGLLQRIFDRLSR